MEYRGIKGTKFIITAGTILLGTVALFVGVLSGELWVAGVVGLAINYVMGNVKEKAIEKVGMMAAMV